MNREVEKKWQRKWQESKVFQPDPENREKMFLTVAYPYPSGSMHIGHGRTYAVPDIYARFKRMQGYNVLFPMGWHVTGAPVIGIAKRIENNHEKTLNLYKNLYKVPQETIESFKEPENIVKYFSNQYHNDMDDMGFSIDWRREFRTTDESYKKFIEWQIRKLKDKDLVRKGSHPVKYCPDCENPVGDHDLLEGEGVGVNELTLIKFEIDGKFLVPATFRPETIYGVTNLWMNPNIDYIEVKNDSESWIISKESFDNLSNQKKELEIVGEVNGEEYIGKMVKNPHTGEKHPILPASFVDEEYGTGVVFSVPGHAPADYIALEDIKNNPKLLEKYDLENIVSKLESVNVITVEGYSQIPAKDVIEGMGVKNQEDPKLQDATNQLYKAEHGKGVISNHIKEHAGKKVRFVRDEIADMLKEKSLADTLYDFAERPVVCRCGEKCVIRIMDNQWFLRYSDESWKDMTRECLSKEKIIPAEVRANFEYYIGWLEDWACSRRIGLGTKLPWDKQWLIEPLSDSTIYMSYYTIAKYLKELDANDLNDALFNKIFLNQDEEGIKIDSDILNQMQEEFNYWYPLDWRLSAKDLIGNHLTFHMFHHTAIFPEDKWPQGIVVFGMGLLEGNKMSSSKGNVILLSDAIEKYGADVVRLFLMSSAEPWQDFDWREKEVKGTQRRLEWFEEFVNHWGEFFKIDLSDLKDVEVKNTTNKWILNQLNKRINSATEALESFQTRKSVQESLFLFKKDVDHYISRIDPVLKREDLSEMSELEFTINTIINSWIKLLSPFIPHTTEELWNKYGGEGFVSEAKWPEINEKFLDEKVEKSEEIIKTLISDINEIKKIINKEVNEVHLYFAPEWKWEIYDLANEIGKPDMGRIIGQSISKNLHDNKKEVADFAKKITKEMTKTKYIGKINEYSAIEKSKDYIESEIQSKITLHKKPDYDPQNKARNAMPYKPAIYIE